jgi:hypothetical protein
MDNIDAFEALLSGDLSKGPVDDLTDEELEIINSRAKKDKDEPNKSKDIKNDDLDDEDDKDDSSKNDTDKNDDDVEDLGEYESDITTFVTSKLEEKLGMSLGKHSKISDVVDELASIVEESTKDVFANEEVAKLNEYVANGGDLKKFYSAVYSGGIDLDNIDIENTSDQKKIIKEDLKVNGYTEAQIERKLSRYEDSGVLQEEAEDATERLKEYKVKVEKELLETTKKDAEVAKKRNIEFVSNVQKSIKELKDIYGIPVTEKQRKDLYNAILVPESDGKTLYQKEYSKNVMNLITSAFVTLYGQELVKKAQDKGATSTAKELKDKLSQKGNRLKNSGSQDTGSNPLKTFAGMLRKNN